MHDPSTDEPSLDARGIRPPAVHAVEPGGAPAGVALLTLRGEFDLAAAPMLRDRLAEARTAAARAVVLDMTEVTFVDSSALRELLRADAALSAAGVPLVLVGLRPPVDRLLELTRTTGMFTVAATVEAALGGLART
jgi:anti-anti-sigma factor